jgi:cation-transporting P-type ATPase E
MAPPSSRPQPGSALSRTFDTPPTGLTLEDVAARAEAGQTNDIAQRTSRSVSEILRANIFTRFNFLLGSLFVLILAVGQPQDGLFGIVLVANALIGIVQELRAKRTLDRLAVLNAPRAHVIREGQAHDIATEDLVLDDLVAAHNGDQVIADGVVRSAVGLQVDESLLTGESEPVDKRTGDLVRSGSFVSAGSGTYQATAIGHDAYAVRLAAEARRFELVRSELMQGINQLLRYVTWAIVPVSVLLIVSQLHVFANWRTAITGVVAGLVAMVPQGLVLLTSIAFGVAAVTLARRQVLVQELPAVEGLARVDVVCLDKTGTLTDGTIVFDRTERLDSGADIEAALGALAAEENPNQTLAAIGRRFPPPDGWDRAKTVPFSSDRKWSGASFEAQGTWVIGAPEIVLDDRDAEALGRALELARSGQRVLALVHSETTLSGTSLPDKRTPGGFVLLEEHVRPDAAATLAYFAEQGVALKVISGDSALTVGAIAARLNVPLAEKPIDARELPDDGDSLDQLLEDHSVFGRVTPQQKQAMVKRLQAQGHTVAMTGDGVNDALALKLADLGIAMGSGAPATRAVAQVVLLDGRFASLPGVLAEGRRVTANIERVANLFITKTVWATLLAVAVSIALWPYPLLPRHLTIIDAIAIGIPSFFLALAPNTRRYVPGFVRRVLRFTIPSGLVVATSMFLTFWLARSHHLPLVQQRTAATLGALIPSLFILVLLAFPLTWRRILLVVFMIVGFVLLFPLKFVRDFYALSLPHGVLPQTILIGLITSAVLGAWWEFTRRHSADPARTLLHKRP